MTEEQEQRPIEPGASTEPPSRNREGTRPIDEIMLNAIRYLYKGDASWLLRKLDEARAGAASTEPQYVTRDSLARALHATSPHAKLHPWESCPQQDFDYRDADDILTYLRLREAV